jgi:putative effector of murein hydrolase LrgA (UPF0299 family)
VELVVVAMAVGQLALLVVMAERIKAAGAAVAQVLELEVPEEQVVLVLLFLNLTHKHGN